MMEATFIMADKYSKITYHVNEMSEEKAKEIAKIMLVEMAREK